MNIFIFREAVKMRIQIRILNYEADGHDDTCI